MPVLMSRCVNVQIELAKQIFCASKIVISPNRRNERT